MEKELNDYRDSAKARLNIFLNAFKSQMDLYQNIQKEKRNDISKLLEQLKALIAQNKKELEEKEKKEEKNKNDYQNANLARQQNRKQEIENVINRKISDRDRQISTLKNNFNSDLNKKKKELEEENKQKLNEYKEKIKSLDNVTNEENQHKTNILKMEGKLNYAVGQFERSKQEGEQKISLLQNEISNTEKTIRQIQRKIKMDSQAIDEEFEMKIQVEQVKLNNTIENISKLYDKEENLRGVELVEAIRKLRQIQNRTDDLCLKKQHEIDDEEKEFKEMQKSLENEIKEMKDKKTINDLTEKLNLLNEKAKNEIESVTKSNLDKIEKIEKQIEEKKTSHSERMNEMKKKIEEENIMFDSSINEFKANENSITNAANEQIDKYKLEYESRKKEMIDKHNEQVAKMKARIESAKGLQNETLEKKNQDYDKASDNENNLIAKKCNFDQESLNKVTQDFLKSDSNYAAKIYELICKIADLQINVYNSTIRKNEQQKINALKESIKKKDTEMAQLFESFYKMVDNVQKVPLSQVQSPLQFHVRPSNSRKSTTRGSKIESPKIIDVSKKHLHPIMSPQVV
ncbi:hypothetical protein TRFO_15747 [Tritrichomonas foetus]|uniref:Uncharacterized protein n=1 Tax=Tritrichomonas foetus TaxID=1144522 RepID=A0A1J4KRS6_9EUKA|nr:hypothetical protein TRFO_15747 [Tritrichomonas foetus]|eukprot:OHT13975.1 hypothetical protein TRFO_15747 [Tritrichomonas foetus]